MSFMKLFHAVCGVLLLSGCATKYVESNIIPIGNQTTNYEENRPVVLSKKEAEVSLSLFSRINAEHLNTQYIVKINNTTTKQVAFDYSNVTASFKESDIGALDVPVRVLTHDDLMFEIQARAESQRLNAQIIAQNGAYDAERAAYTTITVYEDEYYHKGRQAHHKQREHLERVSTIVTYDPMKAQILADENEARYQWQLNNIASNTISDQQRLNSTILKPQLIPAAQQRDGVITLLTKDIPYKKAGFFHIKVTIAGESHEFLVKRSIYAGE